MADALCGPSNALQNFQKHTSVDRTLQQDRISSRQSPAQGFRSNTSAQGQLDAEFNAFEAGYSAPLLADQPNNINAFLPPPPQFASQPSADVSGWATDFQNLHIAGPQLEQPLHQIKADTPTFQANSAGRHHELPRGVQQTPQSTMFQGGMAYRPGMGMLGNPGFARPDTFTPATTESLQSQSKPAEVFDDSAFEAAFAEARAEIELQESARQEESLALQPEELEPAPLETIRIGSDNIPAQLEEGVNESDELSKTAGELLDRVSHDQSQKFKQSNFLALMRQLRDREIVVDGDEFRKVQQPLHPGGPLYPEQSKLSGSLPIDLDSGEHNEANLDESSHQQRAEEDRDAIYRKFLWKSQLIDHRTPNPPDCFFRHDLDIDLLG
ncbi:peroxin 20 [Nannizzia gypsea CBS 118893]|uniref:Peroxin 20 n=1 Tax=Arthroderma gypseum (strain ATCC MYA-4604 / CBS 118893) TaxID=535722 RepID=E5QYK9_ARTGP|nr:peroxin 20 [Nannizzia gypsea CBS 118893]EFQ98872.1 peroxin 20 [Nannizzia gypsea CBS 118893]